MIITNNVKIIFQKLINYQLYNKFDRYNYDDHKNIYNLFYSIQVFC